MNVQSNSFDSRSVLRVGTGEFEIFRLPALERAGFQPARLPFALRILLENLLRHEDGIAVTAADVEALAGWDPANAPAREIAFTPARVLLQDFTGVPGVVDLAAMRDAMQELGGRPDLINPLQPVELVIDHSVQVDQFGTSEAFAYNAEMEYRRNRERYAFLRWGQGAFRNFRVVPPETGIVHQVNLEHLARVVFQQDIQGQRPRAFPDTLVGTDSHTTMINGLGVLGWGVGGIEAEAAMLGQPVSMLIPEVVGFRLEGALPEGATATDLVLTVTQMLRQKGVVGRFVEFFGGGLAGLPLADRATIANMAPEYGATCGLFPVDAETLRYLEFTGRSPAQVQLVEAYMKEQGLFHTPDSPEPAYSDTLTLDLGSVESSLAGPRRPQDRVALGQVKPTFLAAVGSLGKAGTAGATAEKVEAKPARAVPCTIGDRSFTLDDGSIVIAAITSCTNTSNASVMLASGLLAKKAVERGLTTPPWVKTSLAPGSQVVTEYLARAGLTPYLDALGFNLVGYGCTTCIGNSGPLPEAISRAIDDGGLVAVSVLSGNRNFEGRINPDVRANYLASPPLVVAYALAGRIDIDLTSEPIGADKAGLPVMLSDIWPSQQEIDDAVADFLRPEMFAEKYADVFHGDERWRALPVPEGDLFQWDPASTYIRQPPFFKQMPPEPRPVSDIHAARVLALLGDSITTDHISPAGAIRKDSPAGRYLLAHGVPFTEFNSFGARRGNHEVMLRGTFGNVRLRNRMVPGVEGGYTLHLPSREQMSIYDAAMRYRTAAVPLIIIAGKEYGGGSSRDWAAKGTRLLGVRAVIAESFERIHRSNLVGMGILPLQFAAGQSAASLGLNGDETYDLPGLAVLLQTGSLTDRMLTVRVRREDGTQTVFAATVRIDTPKEVEYFRHGGILPYVLRQLLARSAPAGS